MLLDRMVFVLAFAAGVAAGLEGLRQGDGIVLLAGALLMTLTLYAAVRQAWGGSRAWTRYW